MINFRFDSETNSAVLNYDDRLLGYNKNRGFIIKKEMKKMIESMLYANQVFKTFLSDIRVWI